MESDGELKVSN